MKYHVSFIWDDEDNQGEDWIKNKHEIKQEINQEDSVAKTIKLFCENGQHWWKRESQRGRPPLNCPKHRPAPVKKSAPQTVELYCEEGNHTWDWVKRGFEPINCPQHREKKVTAPRTEELYCEAGKHKWIWTVSRGRKPRRCPEHRGNQLTTAPDNGHKKIGLGGLKQRRKRVAMQKMRTRYNDRRRDGALVVVNEAAKRYETALAEEKKLFTELDKLQRKPLKSPKQIARIDELKEQWDRQWRRVNNYASSLHTASITHRKI